MYDSFNGLQETTKPGDKKSVHTTKTDTINTNASQIDQSMKFRGASAGIKSIGKSFISL